MGELLSNAAGKAEEHRTSLQAVWNDLQTMLRLIRDWIAGDYRQVSASTLVAIVGAVAYFLSPLDAVLDVIPVLGLVDDATVIGVVVSQVRGELTAFRTWEQQELPRLEEARGQACYLCAAGFAPGAATLMGASQVGEAGGVAFTRVVHSESVKR